VIIEGELGGVPLDPDFSRLEAVLRREEPDRVPLFEMEIDMPIQEWFLGRELEGAADDIEFYIRAGYDYVPVIPAFLAPRLMRVASGEGLSGSDRERTWITESEGIIKTVADVENFPWPKAEDVDFSLFYDVAALLPPKMKILGMLAPAAIFGNSSQSMGLENFSYALYDNVAVVEALFEILGSTYLEIAKRLTKMPRVGSVHMADDLAHGGGCLVSPKVYRKYVFPWYKKIAGVLTDAGLPLSFHSDGNLEQVLDDLADCGIRGIHPIEPLAMDIVDIKKRYGDRFAIFGNIDLEYTLTRGTVEEVEALVKERIKRLAPGGGYAVGSSNSVPDYVKPENYRAMVEATKKYGKYPISI
jgi:uroporphyrinogen decarboxylase